MLVKQYASKYIVLDFIDSDIVRFFGDNMDILSVDLNIVNLDDPETIIHFRLMTWHIDLKIVKQNLMLVAWHPKR